ncbi:MAG: Peptidyl-tRNA hydrolase [candidate division WS2 bacterium]|nr:Peptidyl-tRNA hydrolase [Candidatus Lithacetigena glycinireducens]
MHLLLGLGNPGREYIFTKHNAGFRTLDLLAREYKLSWVKKYRGLYSSFIYNSQTVEMIKPHTYMNLSGLSIVSYLKSQKIDLSELTKNMLIIHDDLDLPLGVIRFKQEGSSGGQKGVESIIAMMGTKSFSRLKIGIGRPPGGMSGEEFVLLPFTGDSAILFEETIDRAVVALKCYLDKGISYAQSLFN